MSRFKSLLLCASLLGGLLGFASGAFAQTANADNAQPGGPEQRVALVIGNAHYRNAPLLANPDDDAQSMAQLLNSAGFEVISATDLTQDDMVKVVQDFSAKVAARGPNTVAMVYYAGHGVQLAGENYLIPVDARISTPSDLTENSMRLVDVMATLEAIPSRMRIVVLDACRNNPFPNVNDAGRGLAIVDAPNGSIVGYSTAPGAEALDGSGGHSPYTQAFLRLAREPNLPIEQLFKRVRLEVNKSTDGQQIPWESSSLTSEFYFFGDTQLASTRAPSKAPVVQMASNLPSRSVRQAYDYVLSEGSPEYYREFITLFPHDPLCDRIRWLLHNVLMAEAWHKAVLANSPFAYKTFYDNYSSSPYAQVALKLQSQPKIVPLLQPTHLIVPERLAPTLKLTNLGQSKDGIKDGTSNGGNSSSGAGPGKIVTLPAGTVGRLGTNTTTNATNNGGAGKIVTLPAGTRVGKGGTNQDVKTNVSTNRVTDTKPIRNPGMVKPNNNPPPVNHFQGGNLQGKTSVNTSMNSNARFTQSPGRAQGFGRRSFMR